MNLKLSVIIPSYNEAKTIRAVVQKVLKQSHLFEIIVVDDGSRDHTARIVADISSPKIKLIRHPINRGKGAAIITGITHARGTHLLIQDADLELNPADYPRLLKPIRTNQARFVIGNRWEKNHKLTLTRLGNFYLSSLVLLLFGKKISDPYCCYKLTSLPLWKKLKLSSPSFEIEAEIISKILKYKIPVTQVPVFYHPRTAKQGKKIRARDAFKATLKMLSIKF